MPLERIFEKKVIKRSSVRSEEQLKDFSRHWFCFVCFLFLIFKASCAATRESSGWWGKGEEKRWG
jgi:hypothetical protein